MVSTAASRPVIGSSPNGPYSTTSSASKRVRVPSSAPPWMQSTKDPRCRGAGRTSSWLLLVACESWSMRLGRQLAGEVIAVVQIGKQAGLRGFPAEGPARDVVGGRQEVSTSPKPIDLPGGIARGKY